MFYLSSCIVKFLIETDSIYLKYAHGRTHVSLKNAATIKIYYKNTPAREISQKTIPQNNI